MNIWFRSLPLILSFLLFQSTHPAIPANTARLVRDIKLYLEKRKKSGNEIAQPDLVLKMNDHTCLNHSDLAQGKTGLPSLDALNKKFGGYPVNYQNLRLGLAFENMGIPFDHIVAAYLQAQGKQWEVEQTNGTTSHSPKKSKAVKHVWVQLTPAGDKKFNDYKKSPHYNAQKTGIPALDELNELYDATIINTFYLATAEMDKVMLVFELEFAQPTKESTLNEYRSLDEVEKVEHAD